MKAKRSILIPLIAIGVVLFIGYEGFGWKDSLRGDEITKLTNSFVSPTVSVPDEISTRAWQTFEEYREAAKTHDLESVRNLSYQLSAACKDPARETECFGLMDSVYAFTMNMQPGDFKHSLSDDKQIILYTDGPVVAIVFFTRTDTGEPRVLGLRYCLEGDGLVCINESEIRKDQDIDGWWDVVESLFY